MLQRIQSLYLSATSVLIVIMILSSFGTIETSETAYFFRFSGIISDSGEKVYSTYTTSALLIVSLGLSFFTIFLYKKRLFQIKTCKFILLLLTGLLASVVLSMDQAKEILPEADKLIRYNYTVVFPIVCLVFTWLAVRSIRRDEDLVRSSDRMR